MARPEEAPLELTADRRASAPLLSGSVSASPRRITLWRPVLFQAGPGEPDREIHGRFAQRARRAGIVHARRRPIDEVAEFVARTAFKITRVGQLVV